MTVADYIEMKKREGKRCVYWFRPMHDPLDADGPQQLVIVVENERGFMPLGQLSNMPGTIPPLTIVGEAKATKLCRRYNATMDEKEVLRIVLTSMRPDEIKVILDSDEEQVIVFKNGDEMCRLDWLAANSLYSQLRRLGCRCGRK